MLVRLTWDLPAEATHVVLSRRTARMLLEHHGVLDDDIDAVELILGEMCTNVVRHAYDNHAGRYSVELSLDDNRLKIRVTDQGRGFDGNGRRVPEFTEAGGMGLFLMSQFADRVDIQPSESGGSSVSAFRTVRLRSDAPTVHA